MLNRSALSRFCALSQELESERPPGPPGWPSAGRRASADASCGANCNTHASDERATGWRLVAVWLGLWFTGAALIVCVGWLAFAIGKFLGWSLATIWLALAA